MMLGRLAAENVSEAITLVNKIIAYEALPPAAWKQKILFVADNADLGGNFSQIVEDLIDCCLPDNFSPETVYFSITHPDVPSTRSTIINKINQGVFITNYIGHTSRSQWTDEGVFKLADVNSLTNSDKLTIVLSMTCLDGQYQYHKAGTNTRSMADVFTGSAGKGAVASWSPTGMGVSSGHDYLNRGFFDTIFEEDSTTIGEGTIAGKLKLWSTGANLDLLDTYLLFGGPAMRVTMISTARDDEYSMNEDEELSVLISQGVLTNDINPYDLPMNAELSADSGPVHGSLSFNADGSFLYVPESDFNGTDSFTYQATYGKFLSNIATVTILIEAVNDAPIAVADSFSVITGNMLQVTRPGVLSNDFDVDGDLITAILDTGETVHGVVDLNQDGSFRYIPEAGFIGIDSFTYRVTDGTTESAEVTVTLTVLPRLMFLPLKLR